MAVTASHVYHVNVNCSDLEHSLAFYRDALGFVAGAHTAPLAPQPGAAFALDEVQWEAWIMNGANGPAGPVIDLLEWRVPQPEGGPPGPDDPALGFTHLHVTTPVAGGGTLLVDPDGTALVVTEGQAVGLTGVTVGCRDAARTERFFTEVLRFVPDSTTPGDARRLLDPAGAFTVHLREQPAGAAPAADGANRLGIYRMAMLTDAIDEDHGRLVAAGVRCYSAPATLDMGPGLPALRALFFAEPDGATVELIETPRI
jgi:catechol 2,3-dioxygenase-like lactoylglutathione lyase family enzyme